MPKIVEWFNHSSIKTDWKTQYIRYRLGRLKHQYWLWNRKNPARALVDEYDYSILKNCQPGRTVFFASAGYYLKDIWPEIEVVEMHPVVETFYSNNIYICQDRAQLSNILPWKVDNFAVVNNRGDMWTELENITEYCKHYVLAMNPGCRFFYSFRDTQIVGVNRLTINMEQYFLEWAQSLSSIGLELVWNSIDFTRKVPDQNGYYDQLENPDTTNGNLKFWFVYKGQPWSVVS
jgi:hypothetical protein